tara:strand:+ start:250 stop:891 length:642 start_codon:yes stop_codon:yes gene_type:complete
MIDIITQQLHGELKEAKIIVAPKIPTLKSAPHIIEALQKGGISCVEITLRTDISLDIIKLIRTQFPEMKVMAGTIIALDQVAQVQDLGAIVGVAPGIQPKILERAIQLNFPFIPGIATPSEIALGLDYGCKIFKFFPAELLGGLDYLKRVYASYAHRGVQFIPLGGINYAKAVDYLKHPSILSVGGSWIAEGSLVEAEDWDAITQRAKLALNI